MASALLWAANPYDDNNDDNNDNNDDNNDDDNDNDQETDVREWGDRGPGHCQYQPQQHRQHRPGESQRALD